MQSRALRWCIEPHANIMPATDRDRHHLRAYTFGLTARRFEITHFDGSGVAPES